MQSFIDVISMRWLVLNVGGLVLLWYGIDTGVVGATFALDNTPLSEAIVAVFLVGWAYTSFRIWKVSNALNQVLQGKPCDFSPRRERFMLTVEMHIAVVNRIMNMLLLLGISGTMYGLIVATSNIDVQKLADTATVGTQLGVLIDGLHTMFVTTLTGLITAIWLGIHLTILENSYRKLYVVRGVKHVSS